MNNHVIQTNWSDAIWISLFVAAGFTFFVRKLILARYGHRFDLLDTDLKDGQRLRKIAEQENKPELRRLYKGINWAFRLLFCFGAIILLFTRIGR